MPAGDADRAAGAHKLLALAGRTLVLAAIGRDDAAREVLAQQAF